MKNMGKHRHVLALAATVALVAACDPEPQPTPQPTPSAAPNGPTWIACQWATELSLRGILGGVTTEEAVYVISREGAKSDAEFVRAATAAIEPEWFTAEGAAAAEDEIQAVAGWIRGECVQAGVS